MQQGMAKIKTPIIGARREVSRTVRNTIFQKSNCLSAATMFQGQKAEREREREGLFESTMTCMNFMKMF